MTEQPAVTRDVILDLLPAYFAGEASPDTRKLVEHWFAHDPTLARPAAPDAAAEVEKNALLCTRANLRRRGVFMGFAIFASLAPFTIHIADGRVQWFMLRDSPSQAFGFAVAAVVFWSAVWRYSRQGAI